MKFAATILAAAAFAFSSVQADLDWTADSTLQCAQQNWGAIKSAADPMLSTASSMLTSDMMTSLKDLLDSDGNLISDPSIDQLRQAAQIFPTSLFEAFAGDLINKCLATYVSSDSAATDAETTASSNTDAADTTTSSSSSEDSTGSSSDREESAAATSADESAESAESEDSAVTSSVDSDISVPASASASDDEESELSDDESDSESGSASRSASRSASHSATRSSTTTSDNSGSSFAPRAILALASAFVYTLL